MTANPDLPSFTRRVVLTLPRRQPLTAVELEHRRLRRRLLKYILETHRRRQAERVRGFRSAQLLADA